MPGPKFCLKLGFHDVLLSSLTTARAILLNNDETGLPISLLQRPSRAAILGVTELLRAQGLHKSPPLPPLFHLFSRNSDPIHSAPFISNQAKYLFQAPEYPSFFSQHPRPHLPLPSPHSRFLNLTLQTRKNPPSKAFLIHLSPLPSFLASPFSPWLMGGWVGGWKD